MHKIFIGIDNGVSGTIGLIGPNYNLFIETPVFSQQDYTKTKKNITRVDIKQLKSVINDFIKINECGNSDVFVLMERPLVNPTRFQASCSALRCLEAELIIIEEMELAHAFIDSKEWQKKLLPSGIKGTDELKKTSHDVGIRLFPNHKNLINKHKDADGILIAEYCRRIYE